MPHIMKSDAFEAGPFPHPAPQLQVLSKWPLRIDGRGKHERAVPVPLPIDDGASARAQVNGSRAGLAVGEPKRVSLHLGPFQVLDLALAASRVQEKADYVGLHCACGPLLDAPVERLVKADDLLRRQEPREPGSRVHPRAPGGVNGDQAVGDRVVHDLPEKLQRLVGTARHRDAAAFEPGIDVGRSDPVKRQVPERREQMASEEGLHVIEC